MKMMRGIPPAVVSAAQKYKKIHNVHQYIIMRICPVRCILSEEELYQFLLQCRIRLVSHRKVYQERLVDNAFHV